MPDKKVVYFIVAAAVALSACRKAQGKAFRVRRFIDLPEAKRTVTEEKTWAPGHIR